MASAPLHPIHKCQEISEAFLSLHKQHGFETLPASSLLHPSVPMSFVMSAGLIQVENDLEKIIEKTGVKFAFTQPCFRHFDVKQVGTDSTHLSLFNMSAAFHIGCSERETILPRLWHFLIDVLNLNKNRLWVTYLDDEEFGLDQRTHECWLNIGVDKSNLIALDQEYCFWRQRSTAMIATDIKKCGPHTEVFYERDRHFDSSICQCSDENPAACRCGRFVEISNSLFIENNISEEGDLTPAETVFSECVIGIERLAMIIQDVRDVHHVDRFSEWRDALNTNLPETLTEEQEQSVNIALDHLSAFGKLIDDGAPKPGHGGRRYLMKRLVRDSLSSFANVTDDLEILLTIPSKLISPETRKLLAVEIARRSKSTTIPRTKKNRM